MWSLRGVHVFLILIGIGHGACIITTIPKHREQSPPCLYHLRRVSIQPSSTEWGHGLETFEIPSRHRLDCSVQELLFEVGPWIQKPWISFVQGVRRW